ncbi:SGNH/GDSL hydrolase family protein [Cytobacillus purgationiresistens]|uniref:Lysophospholipase L1-like esterase n=1 Tax=Cytobacillus purgationiresistens TaxID=863449 RepID=A0ABU0ANL8_9BACI|nr:SGNH/GDSL hydrolase family protein [Cytobacillus purgationiresistens]MDQ0271998.1 lysophospholipase L1-like esterase [Cytobacillus purgationiresistens]
MNKTFTLLLITSLLLTACSVNSTSNNNEPNSLKKSEISTKQEIPAGFFPVDLNVVSVGDSLTQGVGDTTEKGGYVPYLERLLNNDKGIEQTEIHNYGVRGNRSNQLLNKLETDEVKQALGEADLVIITIGGNDIMKVIRENFTRLNLDDFDIEKRVFEENLRDVLNSIREGNSNSTVLLVGLYNPFLEWFSHIKEMSMIMDDWNQASKSILSDYEGTYFVDIDDIFEKSEEDLLYTDYFHPNNRGYELIAGRIYERLQEEGLNEILERK